MESNTLYSGGEALKFQRNMCLHNQCRCWMQRVLLKRRYISAIIHGVTPNKIVMLIATITIISNLTKEYIDNEMPKASYFVLVWQSNWSLHCLTET
jgi:hypothetical protein